MAIQRTLLAVIATGLALATQAQASSVLFDDASGPDWKVDWGTTNSTIKYQGSVSLAPSGTNLVFLPTATYAVGSNPILDFYANTSTAGSTTVQLRINNNDLGNNNGGIYMVDGVAQNSSLTLDGDTSTWQHVTFDITQPRWYWGNGWESTSLTSSDTLNRVSFVLPNSSLLIDNVQFTSVPEPTSLGLIATGALLALRRRRA